MSNANVSMMNCDDPKAVALEMPSPERQAEIKGYAVARAVLGERRIKVQLLGCASPTPAQLGR